MYIPCIHNVDRSVRVSIVRYYTVESPYHKPFFPITTEPWKGNPLSSISPVAPWSVGNPCTSIATAAVPRIPATAPCVPNTT